MVNLKILTALLALANAVEYAPSSITSNLPVDIALEATRELALINQRMDAELRTNSLEEGRQIGFPTNPLGFITNRIPCTCDKGVCKCCTASALSVIGLNGCMEMVYQPEDFAFELRMKVNNQVLLKRKVSGKNPPPVCFRPPRFNFAKACITFYDVYFFGRNMHVCMDIGGFFQGYELFSRSFDCLQFGAKGVKLVKPEDGYPIKLTDVDIDDSNDEIEDYDENVVRSVPIS